MTTRDESDLDYPAPTVHVFVEAAEGLSKLTPENRRRVLQALWVLFGLNEHIVRDARSHESEEREP